VVINLRRKIFAFDGVWAGATASDIRSKITKAIVIANSQLTGEFISRLRRATFSGNVVSSLTDKTGVVAQLVERLVRNEKVAGSNPVGSTSSTIISPP
jgi:hypothetical protein